MGLRYGASEAREQALHPEGAAESSVQVLVDSLGATPAVLAFRTLQSLVQSSRRASQAALLFTFSSREGTVGKEKG